MVATIVVIEDNPENLEVMTCLLEAGGHRLLSARDGQTGLDTVITSSPDLIICDLHLPKLNGFEVCRQIKASPALKMIPIVAVTAFSMVGDRERVLEAGFDGYISKPINPRNFLKQVESYMSAHVTGDCISG